VATVFACEPDGQAEQATAPVEEKVAGGHGLQRLDAFRNMPAGQPTHAVNVASLVKPGGQAEQ
jgi:hypothetical protein